MVLVPELLAPDEGLVAVVVVVVLTVSVVWVLPELIGVGSGRVSVDELAPVVEYCISFASEVDSSIITSPK